MTTSPVVSVTDELIAELSAEAAHDDGTQIPVSAVELRALLSEREELKRDAERYRWLRDNDASQVSSGTCYDCELYHGKQLDDAIDAAMQS